jgi:hypothetical protein
VTLSGNDNHDAGGDMAKGDLAKDEGDAGKMKISAADRLLAVLAIRPFCDSSPATDLSPEQQAALHQFVYETFASLYRLYQVVPEDVVKEIISQKLRRAFTAAK